MEFIGDFFEVEENNCLYVDLNITQLDMTPTEPVNITIMAVNGTPPFDACEYVATCNACVTYKSFHWYGGQGSMIVAITYQA